MFCACTSLDLLSFFKQLRIPKTLPSLFLPNDFHKSVAFGEVSKPPPLLLVSFCSAIALHLAIGLSPQHTHCKHGGTTWRCSTPCVLHVVRPNNKDYFTLYVIFVAQASATLDYELSWFTTTHRQRSYLTTVMS